MDPIGIACFTNSSHDVVAANIHLAGEDYHYVYKVSPVMHAYLESIFEQTGYFP